MGSKRKILFYTHALAGGGAERVWALLASGMVRRGHEVIFAVDYESNENVEFLDPRVRRVVLPRHHGPGIRALARLLRSERPDVSLSALSISNLKHVAAASLAGARERAILSYHGFFVAEPQPVSRVSYLLTPLLTRVTAATVAVSDALRDHLTCSWRSDAQRLHRIHNPFFAGPPGREPDAEALLRREPLVIAVGRLEPQKGFHRLLRAFAKVSVPDARLMIVGAGSQRERLEADIRRLGLERRVVLTGYVPHPWDLYAKARCLAVASQSESFGLVVAEALAHGLAVVSTDCDGPREILDNGRYGALVPQNDADAMAAALTRALVDPGDPQPRIARAGAFSLDAALDHYDALIADVVERAERLDDHMLNPTFHVPH